MIAVGIRALKDRLSKYLRLVREGETIVVHDRDVPVAEIRPCKGIANGSALDRHIEAESMAGRIVAAVRGESEVDRILAESRRAATALGWREVHDETRADR